MGRRGFIGPEIVATEALILKEASQPAQEIGFGKLYVDTTNNDLYYLHPVDGLYNLLKSLVPIGTVIAVSSEIIPDPNTYLECNGALISKTDFPELYAYYLLAGGGVTALYGETATDFYLPDYQGRFLRGWDNSAGRDPDAASRTMDHGALIGDYVGTIQSDNVGAHDHDYYRRVDGSADSGGKGLDNGLTTTATVNNPTGETRPLNINVMYCVKFI